MELVVLLPVLTTAALFWSVPLAEPVKLEGPVPPVTLQVPRCSFSWLRKCLPKRAHRLRT